MKSFVFSPSYESYKVMFLDTFGVKVRVDIRTGCIWISEKKLHCQFLKRLIIISYLMIILHALLHSQSLCVTLLRNFIILVGRKVRTPFFVNSMTMPIV